MSDEYGKLLPFTGRSAEAVELGDSPGFEREKLVRMFSRLHHWATYRADEWELAVVKSLLDGVCLVTAIDKETGEFE